MERTFQRVCVGGLSLNQRKAVLYYDVIKRRFLEFFALLENLDTCYELIKEEVGDYCKNNDVDLNNPSMKRLQAIIEGVPDVKAITAEFRGRVEKEEEFETDDKGKVKKN